ncbi:DUF3581 family protein [Shewanella sp. Scap07]|uniref:DUF3581 domain-containing protein n=1 Tax=Shewanella sp. Scap07 TaxID=2589987 RepID=UPI0015BC5438|nr:DUF3581 domain-containing protein [Shewanella sp. Scap07]QLE84256.1 DUF3581 family protein [Shewanella sp. Scap07]
MFLTPYFSKQDQTVHVTAQQASDFAKAIASDFNPIHNVGAKRFCVPGDLLFALVLNQYGLHQKMHFTFEGMVGDGVELQFADSVSSQFAISDSRDKTYLQVETSGDKVHCATQIESFVRSYVAFSGLNFIHVLVPMMKQHQMMINPARPLVIYESMSFDLHTLDFDQVSLKLVDQQLEITGKRGDVTLSFELLANDRVVGTGVKTLVMSGLRPYEAEKAAGMVADYESYRHAFEAA